MCENEVICTSILLISMYPWKNRLRCWTSNINFASGVQSYGYTSLENGVAVSARRIPRVARLITYIWIRQLYMYMVKSKYRP